MVKLVTLTNKNIKKIVCVYQLHYANILSPGIGDFIRGCFYVMQLSKLLNIEFELDISNHPIEKYIENTGKNQAIKYDKIEWIIGYNRPKHLWKNKNNYFDIRFANIIINKLNNYNDSDTYGFFTNAFPISYNFLNTGKEIIKNMLKPTDFMQEYINYTLDELKLQKNTYATIHIRCGDKYLTNKENMNMNIQFINKIKQNIDRIIIPNKKYLIISDCNYLKFVLKSYSNFYIINRQIEHLGGDNMKSSNTPGIMNTLLDFYLMGYSNAIFALSVYEHISGFSQYCAVINSIPFNYIII